jgi:hypothetical protein
LVPVTTDPEQRIQARKTRRATAARRRYAENIASERERCRTSKQHQRKAALSTTRGNKYDPADYADEWEFLTWAGTRSDEIIRRSQPHREWFTRHVLPLVHRALCATCGDMFNPQVAGTLTRCSKTCGIGQTENRSVLEVGHFGVPAATLSRSPMLSRRH